LSESDHPDPGITRDPLATGPKDLAEYEASRQAKLAAKPPSLRQVFREGFKRGQAKVPIDVPKAPTSPRPSFRQRRDAAFNTGQTKIPADVRKAPPSSPPSSRERDDAVFAADRARQLARESDERARLTRAATPKTATKKKSAKVPFAIALIAGAAFLFLRANPATPAPATPATQAAVAPAGPSWTAYVARTATWGTTMAADSRALASDASAYDVSSLSADARTLQTDAEAYSFWLDQLGILPCYHAVWTASQTAAAAYVQAGHWAAKWADASPNGNPDDLSAATNYLIEAGSDVDQVTSQAQSVSCP